MADWLRRIGWRIVAFLTCWTAEDPDPTYSAADRRDGLGGAR